MKRWLIALVGFAVIATAAYLLTAVLSDQDAELAAVQDEEPAANAPDPVPSSPPASTSRGRPGDRPTAASPLELDRPGQRGRMHSPAAAASRQAELEHHIRKPGELISPEPISIPRDPVQDRAGLGKEEIQAAIKAVTPLVKSCYEKRLKEKNELQGKAVVKFTIVAKDGEGSIDEGEIKSSSLEDLRLDTCVLHALSKARFPLPRNEQGRVVVTYPFTFRRASK
jgi:TonB family protein